MRHLYSKSVQCCILHTSSHLHRLWTIILPKMSGSNYPQDTLHVSVLHYHAARSPANDYTEFFQVYDVQIISYAYRCCFAPSCDGKYWTCEFQRINLLSGWKYQALLGYRRYLQLVYCQRKLPHSRRLDHCFHPSVSTTLCLPALI